MIPDLKIGGGIQAEVGNGTLLQLDNMMLLERLQHHRNRRATTDDNTPSYRLEHKHKIAIIRFVKEAYQRAKAAKSHQTELASAHLISVVNLIFQHLEVFSHVLCSMSQDIQHLRAWAIRHFPSTAASWLGHARGTIIQPAGDAYIVHNCRKFIHYKVQWTRHVNNTCYDLFPVYIPSLRTYHYLRLADRNLLPFASPIHCSDRAKHTFIVDVQDTLWVVTASGNLSIVEKHHSTIKFPHLLQPPKGFNMHLTIKEPPVLDPISVLNIVSQSQGAIRQLLNFIQQLGSGNDLISGLGIALGASLESLGSAGSEIIGSVGSALKESFEGFGNADEKIINSLGNGLSNVISSSGHAVKDASTGFAYIFEKFFGGIKNILVWLVLLIIVLYLVYLKISDQKSVCKCTKPHHKSNMLRNLPENETANITLDENSPTNVCTVSETNYETRV